MQVKAEAQRLHLSKPFGISRGIKTLAEVIQVTITSQGHTGFGEAVPYPRFHETTARCLALIAALPHHFGRLDLEKLLPAGASRNAVDAALWDLEAKITGEPVWKLAGCGRPQPLPVGYTVSLDNTKAMVSDATAHGTTGVIKIKLGGDDDAAVIAHIREVAPDARLIVDANEGWSVAEFHTMIPLLIAAEVELIEQPVPSGDDRELETLDCPIPLCADESFPPGAHVSQLSSAYSCLNIKLDKSGGLTTALKDFDAATKLGLDVMVGCMVGSSLSVAPAFLLAQRAAYSDLDGFLHIAADHEHPMVQQEGFLTAPELLWGYPSNTPDR